jgi:HlyD family secretion protein
MFRPVPILVVVAIALAAIAGYGLWQRTAESTEGRYLTEPVDRGPVVASVTATGTVNPLTTVQVGTYVSGPILAIDVDFNSPVAKGQRVAQIDPAPFQVKVQKAEASLANARAKLEKSRADLTLKQLTYDRNVELRAKNLIAQHDVDAARSDYQQARAQVALDEAGVQQAQAELAEARINLGYTAILSPVDGVVVSRNVDVGQTVAASFQTPTLFLIAQDLTKMQVNANVSESDIGDVQPGQTATFGVDAYPGRSFHGAVTQVRNAPVTVQNVVTYDVVIDVANPDLGLKPGMTATVNIITAEQRDSLRVPLRALRFDPGRDPSSPTPSTYAAGPSSASPAVWVAQPDGSLRRVEVEIGLRDERYGVLTSENLQVGDPLAIAFRSSKGDAAAPRSSSMTSRPRFR